MKKTLEEDNLDEDDITGRQPHMKTTSQEDDLRKRGPHRKTDKG